MDFKNLFSNVQPNFRIFHYAWVSGASNQINLHTHNNLSPRVASSVKSVSGTQITIHPLSLLWINDRSLKHKPTYSSWWMLSITAGFTLWIDSRINCEVNVLSLYVIAALDLLAKWLLCTAKFSLNGFYCTD